MIILDIPGLFSLLLRMMHLMSLRNWLRLYKMKTIVVLNLLEVIRGGEFQNERFNRFCEKYGISHSFYFPRTLQQNSVVERKNRLENFLGLC